MLFLRKKYSCLAITKKIFACHKLLPDYLSFHVYFLYFAWLALTGNHCSQLTSIHTTAAVQQYDTTVLEFQTNDFKRKYFLYKYALYTLVTLTISHSSGFHYQNRLSTYYFLLSFFFGDKRVYDRNLWVLDCYLILTLPFSLFVSWNSTCTAHYSLHFSIFLFHSK